MWLSLAILAATIAVLFLAAARRGAQDDDLDQAFKDEEQAKALREWKDAR